MSLSLHHLTSTAQLSREDTDTILLAAHEMEHVLRRGGDTCLTGKILASLFYEPSTRTRLSFETAMIRLGGNVVSTEAFQFSSLYKGESIEDTIRVVGHYTDIICMRHPERGSADRAAAVSPVPFINAGDGPGQHPTQALLDLYTIQKERGQIDNLRIALVGDLHYGRTVHSLISLLSLYSGIRFVFVSPPELHMPPSILASLQEKNIPFEEHEELAFALPCDILYMTRIQEERFSDRTEFLRLKDSYTLQRKDLPQNPPTILHPLPRVSELALDLDDLPQAAYFRQAKNGIPVRMALLALLLHAI